jgi:uridine kinase
MTTIEDTPTIPAELSWFAMSATFGRALKAKEYLESHSVRCFIPMRYEVVSDGKQGKARKLVPAINNLLFVYAEREQLNYDHPDAFDTSLLISHLKALRRGEPIEAPIYDYTVHNRSRNTRTVEPTRVVVLEGILIFDSPEIRELLDMKIFVDTDADVRILRRIVRDVRERGRTLESVIGQYLKTVKPMHEAFVEPSKKYADIIVPEGGENPVAYEMIIGRIEKILSE